MILIIIQLIYLHLLERYIFVRVINTCDVGTFRRRNSQNKLDVDISVNNEVNGSYDDRIIIFNQLVLVVVCFHGYRTVMLFIC